MIFTFDPLAIVTFQRLSAIRAFIDLLDVSLPEVEWRQREDVNEQDLDDGEHSYETQVLDERFNHWIPRLSAYSVITLLQSFVEAQLFACAERLGHKKSMVFSPRDLIGGRGRTLEAAALYLRKAGGVEVKTDSAWARLKDLQHLRDIIVHRSGTRGTSEDHQKTFDDLIDRYYPLLSLAEQADWLYGEIGVSLNLCRQFADDVGRFFARVLTAIGVKEQTIPREYR